MFSITFVAVVFLVGLVVCICWPDPAAKEREARIRNQAAWLKEHQPLFDAQDKLFAEQRAQQDKIWAEKRAKDEAWLQDVLETLKK